MSCELDNWRTQYRGDTWTIPVEAVLDGVPENLTGCELWFTLKANLADPDPGVLQRRVFVPSNPAAAAGVAEIVVPATLTAIVEPGYYYFDVQRIRPGAPNNVRTLVSGEFNVIYDVTRTVTPGPTSSETSLLLWHVNPDDLESPPANASRLFLDESAAAQLMRSDRSLVPLGSPSAPGFDYLQSAPASQWSITHGLGRAVSVDVFDVDGEQIYPSVRRVSPNAVLVIHARPQAGSARIQ